MAHVSRLTEEMMTPSSFFSSSCSRVGSRKGKTLHWQRCVCMWTPGPLGLKRRHDWFWIMSLTKASLKELVPTQGLECWQGLWGTSSWGSSEEIAGVWVWQKVGMQQRMGLSCGIFTWAHIHSANTWCLPVTTSELDKGTMNLPVSSWTQLEGFAQLPLPYRRKRSPESTFDTLSLGIVRVGSSVDVKFHIPFT